MWQYTNLSLCLTLSYYCKTEDYVTFPTKTPIKEIYKIVKNFTRSFNFKTLSVKTGWTQIATNEGSTFGTEKAPIDVDVIGGALLGLGAVVVLRADHLGVGQFLRA
jgi:hypothetical protein